MSSPWMTRGAIPLFLLANAGVATGAAAQGPITAFVNVSVIPMDRERVLADQTVVVQGGTITAIGPANTVVVPAEAVRIRGDGMFLMPGLGDCHVHLGELRVDRWRQDPAIEDLLFTFVANGITTVRDMHGGPTVTGDGQYWGPALRERIARGEVLGPRLYVAGDPEHSSPAAAAQSVQALKAAGYDFVKFSAADSLYDSIVATARRVGLPAVGHALGSGTGIGSGWRERLGDALTDRWSSIEHLTGYVLRITGLSPLDLLMQPSTFPAVADSTLRRVALETRAAGVWNCPTPAADEVWDSNPFNEARRWEQAFHRRLIKALHANGAMLLLGTDAGSPKSTTLRPAGGFTIHRALELLVEAGLTPYQALETGTRNFAQYLNVLDSAGTIVVGKRADLVLLKANPLVNVGNTRTLAGVMVAGRWLSRDAAQAYIDTLRVGHNATCRSRGSAVDTSCVAPPIPDARRWGSPDAQLRLLSRMIWR